MLIKKYYSRRASKKHSSLDMHVCLSLCNISFWVILVSMLQCVIKAPFSYVLLATLEPWQREQIWLKPSDLWIWMLKLRTPNTENQTRENGVFDLMDLQTQHLKQRLK